MTEPIKFECEIRQVKTMADHTVNVTLNIPEYNVEASVELLRHIQDMAVVAIAPLPKQD